jgi:hypothetical protein
MCMHLGVTDPSHFAQYVVARFSPFLESPFVERASARGTAHLLFGMPSSFRIASDREPGWDFT